MSSTIPFEGDEAPRRTPEPLPPAENVQADRGRQEARWVRGLTSVPLPGPGPSGFWECDVPNGSWRSTCLRLHVERTHRLASLWAERLGEGVVLRALWLGGAGTAGILLRTLLDGRPARCETLLPEVAPALYFEREVGEMFGVEFSNSPDHRPLLLHYQHLAPPMLRGVQTPTPERLPFAFVPVEGEGVYEIPAGPVHAGVIEPGHFRFQAMGEEILNLEVRLGYTHKGTERLFQGRDPRWGVRLSESISGDHSVAGSVAYAIAVEQSVGLPPLNEATEACRGTLLEAERMASLLGDIAGIILDVGYAAGAAQANVLRNEAYGLLETLTGSRLGRGATALGGLARPLGSKRSHELASRADVLGSATAALLRHVEERPSIMDRLRGTGVISGDVAEALGLVGPTARASGVDRDVRKDRPYGAYREAEIHVAQGSTGDVESRLWVKVEEVLEASRLFRLFLERAGGGEASRTMELPRDGPAFGLGMVESPRGEFLVAVSLDQGKLARVHVRDPSFLNWPAIEYAVRGNIVPDFPLCNKSLNLSYSGFDR